jgi:uncharacterized protein YdaU (DUF1376 family)
MNYYPHHIGDFNNATRHLTRIERSLYRDMIELYYDTEQPLTLDIKALCRKLLARTEEETTAVEQVLSEFFIKTDSGWFHQRCEEIIQEYRDSVTAKSLAGKASAAKREAERQAKIDELNRRSTGVERVKNEAVSSVQLTKNQEPITVNQEPAKEKAPRYVALDDLIEKGVDPQVAADWLACKKAKKSPASKTAIDGTLRELAKADLTPEDGIRLCCERGWASFNPEWLNKNQARGSPGYQTPNEKAKTIADRLTGRGRNEQHPTIIDITPGAARELD